MELRVLQYFLAVAREQSISAAAQSLHLSQPTLSTQLKTMEQQLGKQLFIRGTKGSRKVTLTEEGKILQKRAEEILELVQKTENEILLADQLVAGDICIGLAETQVFRLFAKAAGQLREKYPNIHYHLFSGNAMYVLEQLDKGLIDFGLVYGTVDASRYESIRMPIRDSWGVLMRKDAPLAQKESICPEDLWEQPLIISNQKSDDRPLEKWFKKDFSRLNIVATYNLLFNATLLTSEGLGYTLCLDRLVDTAGSGNLCFRPLTPSLETEAYLIWKKYPVFSKAAEKFLEQLRLIIQNI